MKKNPKSKYAKHRARIQPASVFDKAICGKMSNGYLVYDHSALVSIFMEKDGFTMDEAIDWISYNISCLPLALAYSE